MIAYNNLIAEIENEILELVDNQDDYTRSDLQGRAAAIAMKAYSQNRILKLLEEINYKLDRK